MPQMSEEKFYYSTAQQGWIDDIKLFMGGIWQQIPMQMPKTICKQTVEPLL